MKKILHILVLPKLTGCQRVSLEILNSLPDTQYEKWVLFSNEIEGQKRIECEEAFTRAGVKVMYSEYMKRAISIKDVAAIWEIYRLCKEKKFDIVHTHSTKPGIIGRIAATFAGIPLVMHTVHGLAFHQFVSFPKWQFYWACEMFASLFCDKIVLVNRFYNCYFKWFKKKTTTIYNGIDFSSFSFNAKNDRKEEKEGKEVKILFVGRLDFQKDPLTLLQSASIVCRKYPCVKYTLVGDGEKYMQCEQFLKENNLQNNVELVGWQNDVASYYSSHDIFIASSIYESFGLMFVEAGFYHLPIVATNVEGIPEVVENGVCGLTCNPKDFVTLAENTIMLIEDSSLRHNMGEMAYHRMISLFSVQRMTLQYKATYEEWK